MALSSDEMTSAQRGARVSVRDAFYEFTKLDIAIGIQNDYHVNSK